MGITASSFCKRDLTPEIMDDLDLDKASHEKALAGLERINALSFAARSFWAPLQAQAIQAGSNKIYVLDIACGGGDLTRELTRKARAENLPIVFEGCDFNPRAVDYAKRQAQANRLNINYFTFDVLRDAIPLRFCGVINSLFLHHLSENEIIVFFKNFLASQSRFIFIADLKRSFSGWLLAQVATRCLSASPVVHADGPQSVRAALTPAEILILAQRAGLSTAQVKSIWPMRYLLTYQRP